MSIYDILKKTNPEDVISKIKLHYGNKNIDLYKNLFYDLLNMNPTCNGQKLCVFITAYKSSENDAIRKLEIFDENDLTIEFDVSAYELSSNTIYSIASSPYADFLNYTVDEKTLRNYSFPTLLAHCFYEITSYGFEDNI